ncbi:hypothetical protein PUNSTDRAFT_137423 [Punctularia strigosozonata HHB-11173 SS5]|uniref:uncharacterized protein n=1 Tax=Punctularia strigosozonata (strain HHB-11173) TaxID=741275 RepID=UPI00044182C7|nr:uncharacterized protein PUNSTDRAFT_137423 [Punctularia strigosozonata HHB-11173 SS5]EIN05939.1 hypothetical protein PUNSTDRAFT_137423 [Punctularia strigosozonata HHB-11173 SS5]
MSDGHVPSNVAVAKRRRQDDDLGQREPLPVDVEEVVEGLREQIESLRQTMVKISDPKERDAMDVVTGRLVTQEKQLSDTRRQLAVTQRNFEETQANLALRTAELDQLARDRESLSTKCEKLEGEIAAAMGTNTQLKLQLVAVQEKRPSRVSARVSPLPVFSIDSTPSASTSFVAMDEDGEDTPPTPVAGVRGLRREMTEEEPAPENIRRDRRAKERLQEELVALRERYQRLEDEYRKAEERSRMLQQSGDRAVENATAEMATLKAQSSKQSERMSILETECQRLRDQLHAAESEQQSLRQQVEEQSQAANENQNVAFSAQEEMVKANREIASLRSQLNGVSTQLQRIQADADIVVSERDDLRRQVMAARHERDAAEEKLAGLDQQFSELQANLGRWEAEGSRELASLKEALEKESQKVGELKRELEVSAAEYNRLKNSLERGDETARSKVQQHKDQLAELRSEHEALSAQFHNVQRAEQEAQNRINELIARHAEELSKVEDEHVTKEKKLEEEYRAANAELLSQIAILQRRSDDSDIERNQLLADATAERDQLRADIEKERIQLRTQMEEERARLQGEMENERTQSRTDMEEEQNRLQKKMNECAQLQNDLEEECTWLRTEMKNLSDQCALSVANIHAAHEDETKQLVASHEATLNELREQLAEARGALDDVREVDAFLGNSSLMDLDDPEDDPVPTTTSRPVMSDGSQTIETRDRGGPDDVNLPPSSSSRLLDALDNSRRTNQEALLEIKGRLLALVDDTQDMKERSREVQETLVRNGELHESLQRVTKLFEATQRERDRYVEKLMKAEDERAQAQKERNDMMEEARVAKEALNAARAELAAAEKALKKAKEDLKEAKNEARMAEQELKDMAIEDDRYIEREELMASIAQIRDMVMRTKEALVGRSPSPPDIDDETVAVVDLPGGRNRSEEMETIANCQPMALVLDGLVEFLKDAAAGLPAANVSLGGGKGKGRESDPLFKPVLSPIGEEMTSTTPLGSPQNIVLPHDIPSSSASAGPNVVAAKFTTTTPVAPVFGPPLDGSEAPPAVPRTPVDLQLNIPRTPPRARTFSPASELSRDDAQTVIRMVSIKPSRILPKTQLFASLPTPPSAKEKKKVRRSTPTRSASRRGSSAPSRAPSISLSDRPHRSKSIEREDSEEDGSLGEDEDDEDMRTLTQKLEHEKAAVPKEARRRHTHYVKHAVHKVFNIKEDLAIVGIQNISEEDMRIFMDSDGHEGGPTEERLVPDLATLDSLWNRRWLELMVNKTRDFFHYEGAPPEDIRSNEYWADIAWTRLGTLQTIWRKRRLRTDPETGKQETVEEAVKRIADERSREAKARRHYNLRKAKYERRLKAADQIVEARKDAPDVESWRFIRRMIDLYGPQGMSSEDSGGEDSDADSDQGGRDSDPIQAKVFTVKCNPWRRDIETELGALEKMHAMLEQPKRSQGRAQAPRERPPLEERKLSKRPAVPGLPRSYYSDDWFESLSVGRKSVVRAKLGKSDEKWPRFTFVE